MVPPPVPCACSCNVPRHAPKLVVLTGGPGAGKTAVLEIVRRRFCKHVHVLPEAASIVFGGGFPRTPSPIHRGAAQRAIFHVERELERLVLDDASIALGVCDRGTLDGLAYVDDADAFLRELGTSLDAELARYATVIHLRTPSENGGYNHDNPLRIETAAEARRIDQRISEVWSRHPRRFVVESTDDFLQKAVRALELIRDEVPPCCGLRDGSHAVAGEPRSTPR